MMSVVVILLGILCSTLAMANEAPTKLDGAVIIAAENVRDLMTSGAKVYDVRAASEYTHEHIPKSKNIPYQEKLNLSKKISNKEDPAIFHCNGQGSWRSYKASAQALKEGYKQVYWFRGGLPEWKKKGFAVEKE